MNLFLWLHQYTDVGLLALRLAAGVIFIAHGKEKFGMWKPNPSMKGGMQLLMQFLSLAEPLIGVALIVGFLTQIAALGGALIVIGATYLKIYSWHIPFKASNSTGWEFDLMILGGCLVLLFTGAGAWGLDHLLFGM